MTTTNTPERATERESTMINPQELRNHADLIEQGDVSVLRAGALLREAADAMQGFFDTREMRREELTRLYAIEKAVNTNDALQAENKRLREQVKALEPDIAWLRTQAVSTAKAMTMLQDRRTADYKSRGDLDANYKGIETHETREWQLAEKLSALLNPTGDAKP